MSLITASARADAPAIYLSSADYDLIAEFALRMAPRDPELSQIVLQEIDRAQIHEGSAILADTVGIGSEVTFSDGSNDAERTVRVVLPGQADIGQDRISVMTPVGAGLIGMRVGGQIEWPRPDGSPRLLTILRVDNPGEGKRDAAA